MPRLVYVAIVLNMYNSWVSYQALFRCWANVSDVAPTLNQHVSDIATKNIYQIKRCHLSERNCINYVNNFELHTPLLYYTMFVIESFYQHYCSSQPFQNGSQLYCSIMLYCVPFMINFRRQNLTQKTSYTAVYCRS